MLLFLHVLVKDWNKWSRAVVPCCTLAVYIGPLCRELSLTQAIELRHNTRDHNSNIIRLISSSVEARYSATLMVSEVFIAVL